MSYELAPMKSARKGQAGSAISAIIGLMVVILVAAALLPTINENTDEATDSGGELENISASSKTIIDLVPLMFAVGLLLVAVVWATGKK